MNELIEIKEENGELLVSARELHKGLGIVKRFSAWIEQYIIKNNKYGFEESIDFTSVLTSTVVNNGAKRELQDYALKIEMAKEICMITANDKGKMFRKYFIECEKKLKEQVPQLSEKEMLQLAILNGNELERISSLKKYENLIVLEATTPLIEEIEELTPKAEYTDNVLNSSKLLTTTDIAKDLGMSARKLNDILNEKGVIYKHCGTWYLYSKYQDMIPEYADYKINEYNQQLKWTEKGRKWIIDLLKK